MSTTLPVHTYIWKIASRCNLNCTYCYVYNRGDSRWQQQPRFPDEKTAKQVVARIREHCDKHDKTDVHIVFHGGEPLLVGAARLRKLGTTVREAFAGTKTRVKLSMQTNGLLFTPEIGDVMLEQGIDMGISIDGPPRINDVHRLDLQGQPSSARLEQKLALIRSERYRSLLGGFLIVINVLTDPAEIFDYVAQYEPLMVDFLLPFDNYDRRPLGKEEFEATPYGDWLIRLFDHWCRLGSKTQLRIFDSIIRICVGGRSVTEQLGVESTPDLVVVETNGDIEGLDTLKSTFEGAGITGANVFRNSFDEVIEHDVYAGRMLGANALAEECQRCGVLRFCGGGYLPNRYSSERGFRNPSIYCRDLEKIIRHVHRCVSRQIEEQRQRRRLAQYVHE